MNIDRSQFIATLGATSLHKALKASILPFQPEEKPANLGQFISELYSDIIAGQYFPSVPRGYIVMNKHRGVSRIVPVLAYADSCIYYFCIKQIETAVAVNRIEGTFGGWHLGNPIRLLEERDIGIAEEKLRAEMAAQYAEDVYAPSGSYDPFLWAEQWSEFQRLAYMRANSPNINSFIEFDISNFYDSINLDLLERKIRVHVDPQCGPVIDLLFVLLRNWNRRFEGYGPKSVGIPQDDAGDCSRILANFYLQDYDSFMWHSGNTNAFSYIRYADDQIIMSDQMGVLRSQIALASAELHRSGMNINSGKVTEFNERDAFNNFWAFELFDYLADLHNREAIGHAAREFARRLPSDVDEGSWRWFSVFKRLLSVGFNGFDSNTRQEIVSFSLSPDLLSKLEYSKIKQLWKNLSTQEQVRMETVLSGLIDSVPHNSFHLNLLRFYGDKLDRGQHNRIQRRLRQIDPFST